MKHNKVNNAARCPACQSKVNSATDPTGRAVPVPGDLSVCAYCSAQLVFNSDLTVRLLLRDEYDALPADVQRLLDHFQAVLKLAKKNSP